jgi:hypothetical protein
MSAPALTGLGIQLGGLIEAALPNFQTSVPKGIWFGYI